MSVYRFPAMAGLEDYSTTSQLNKIGTEHIEAINAYVNKERQEYGMELLDIIHAVETALRMEFSEEEVEELCARVIKKNARRGYYKEVK